MQWGCDPTHARTLLCEYSMFECKGKETLVTKESVGKSGLGEPSG